MASGKIYDMGETLTWRLSMYYETIIPHHISLSPILLLLLLEQQTVPIPDSQGFALHFTFSR